MQAELLEILKKNPVANMPVMGFFENYKLQKQTLHNTSMILEGTSDYTWAYLCIDDPNDLEALMEKFDFSTMHFANVEDWMIPILTRKYHLEWKLFTNRYYLPEDTEVEPTDKHYSQLDLSQVGYVYQNSAYKDYTSEEYISQRLTRDVSAGIWVNETLAGWGLTHDDGSIGFLNVLSEFRGQGIGEAVSRALILAKRERNKPVFVNVEPQNQQSISLLQKLGFVFDRPVSWVKLS
jgi:ribosomal protein S18 acetylase RimI-like enzyme